MATRLNERVVAVFTGGEAPPPQARRWIPSDALVIAADSGLDHAHRLGFGADLLVGDLDSVSADALQRHAGPTDTHPPDKDQTDLELAMEVACAEGSRVIVIGGHGGRLDHLLANASLLAGRRWSDNRIIWLAGFDLATVITDNTTLFGAPGNPVSLIPLGGPAEGVTTEGLKWPLKDATLSSASTLGTSNRFLGAVAEIKVRRGVVLAVQPDAIRNGDPLQLST